MMGDLSTTSVTLVYPPFSQIPFSRGSLLPPLGLGYLASILRRRGARVRILDLSTREHGTVSEFTSAIHATSPDVVGITALSFSWEDTRALIREVKAELDLPIVVGGPHVSAMGRSVLEDCPQIDFALSGEAEQSLPLLLVAMNNSGDFSRIPGLTTRRGDRVETSPVPGGTVDLDQLPLPSWDLLDLGPYRSRYAPSGRLMPVMASRGCPYPCAFCAVAIGEGHVQRVRSPSSVVSELSWLESEFHTQEVVFNDNVFTLDREITLELLNSLIRAGTNVGWMCSTRIENVDAELLCLMRKAGCFRIYFGVESGSPEIQHEIRKRIDLEKVRKRIREARDAGIRVEAGFVVGFPDETVEQIQRTIDFAVGLECDEVQFSYYLPLPGTQLYKSFSANGGVVPFGGYHGFHRNPVIIPAGMTSSSFEAMLNGAYDRFAHRPPPVESR